MKKILFIISVLWASAVFAQPKLLGEGANKYTRDSFDIISRSNIVCWGNSLTETNRWEFQLMRLTGRYVHNKGVGGETSTQIKNRMIADTTRKWWNHIFWAGRNNVGQVATVQSDIAAMVAALPHTRYLVFSVTNSRSEPSGSANYINIASINAGLSSTYGSRFVDVRSWLISKYDPSVPQDVTDHGNDVPPSTLMLGDGLHTNWKGDSLIAVLLDSVYMTQFATANPGVVSSAALNNVNVNNLYLQNVQLYNNENKDYFTAWKDGEYTSGTNLPAFSRLHWTSDKFFSGYLAGPNSTGARITLIGYSAGSALTTGADNVGYGANVFTGATTHSNLTAIGSNALSLTVNSANTGIGAYAGRFNTTGLGSTWVGYNSGNLTGQISNASNSNIFGANAYANRSNQNVFGNVSTTETQLMGAVGVNLLMVAPKTNAQLQINSTTKGLIIPRMSAAQRLAISVGSGDSSLRVFDLDSIRTMEYSGSAWRGVRYTNESAVSSSGDYTPTITNVANLISSSGATATYYMVADKVHIDGSFSVSLTALVSTTINISMPFASNFTTITDAKGMCNFVATASNGGTVTADTTNDLITFNFTATNTSGVVNFSLSYTVK